MWFINFSRTLMVHILTGTRIDLEKPENERPELGEPKDYVIVLSGGNVKFFTFLFRSPVERDAVIAFDLLAKKLRAIGVMELPNNEILPSR